MTTYAARFSAVLGPVVEQARRRWSQSSAAGESPQIPVIATVDEEAALETPPHSPTMLTSNHGPEDTESEQTLVAVESSLALHPPASQPTVNAAPTTPPPSMSPPEGPINASASNPRTGQQTYTKSSALPENDGQQQLRDKLVEIAKLELSERERARRMHLLMTEKYNASQIVREMAETGFPAPNSPPVNPQDRLPQPGHRDNPYKLCGGDTDKTYYAGPSATESEYLELGCSHYRRGVKLQCSTCERWHTCRFCHDENEDHTLVRRETKNMLCMHCGKAQPAGQDCKFCGVRSARYYCDKCKLWDDDSEKSIYHCNDCGICRIGQGLGKDFFHCKKCGVCMSIALEGSHRCIERSTECDCPICGEFMFTSTLTVVFMSCGHSIHHKCYYEHMKNSYRCPTCARTIVNMESQFRALDTEIENQPLPPPYDAWRCLITCNDCSCKSNVVFHFLGLKCENCKSYNTSQVRIIRPEDGPNGAENVRNTSVAVPGSLERTSSNNSLTASALSSPPRSAPAEAGTGVIVSGLSSRGTREEERTLVNANRAIAAADEAIGMVIDSGDGNGLVIVDDGWETEDSDDYMDMESDEDEADVGDAMEEDDEEDDDEDEIALIGHR